MQVATNISNSVVMGRRMQKPANIQQFNNKINEYKMTVKDSSPSRTIIQHQQTNKIQVLKVKRQLNDALGSSSN